MLDNSDIGGSISFRHLLEFKYSITGTLDNPCVDRLNDD